jgi:glutathione transport system permease protein
VRWRSWKSVRRRWPGAVGLVTTLLIGIAVVLAPWLAPFDPNAPALQGALAPPRWGHVFGRDELGRDVLSRVLYGGRTSLLIGVGSVMGGLMVGGVAGVLAGYRGGWTDALIMRGMEVPQVFSGFILAIWALAVLGPGTVNVVTALALRSVPVFARIGRNVTVSLRERQFVEAATAMGSGGVRILSRHLLPHLTSPLLVVATLRVGSAIVVGASLSFLGLGVPAEVPEWGVMVKNGMSYMRLGAYHLVAFPGLAIMVTVLGLNLLGEDLRDRWTPRTAAPRDRGARGDAARHDEVHMSLHEGAVPASRRWELRERRGQLDSGGFR